jgi:hypothetical protein
VKGRVKEGVAVSKEVERRPETGAAVEEKGIETAASCVSSLSPRIG